MKPIIENCIEGIITLISFAGYCIGLIVSIMMLFSDDRFVVGAGFVQLLYFGGFFVFVFNKIRVEHFKSDSSPDSSPLEKKRP